MKYHIFIFIAQELLFVYLHINQVCYQHGWQFLHCG